MNSNNQNNNQNDARQNNVKVETRDDASSRNAPATVTPGSSRQQSDAKAAETNKTQRANYYGRTIGNPVKVERQMQQKTERVAPAKTERAAPAKVERTAPERKATQRTEKTSTERTTKTNNGRR